MTCLRDAAACDYRWCYWQPLVANSVAIYLIYTAGSLRRYWSCFASSGTAVKIVWRLILDRHWSSREAAAAPLIAPTIDTQSSRSKSSSHSFRVHPYSNFTASTRPGVDDSACFQNKRIGQWIRIRLLLFFSNKVKIGSHAAKGVQWPNTNFKVFDHITYRSYWAKMLMLMLISHKKKSLKIGKRGRVKN